MSLPTWTSDFTSGRANAAWWTRGASPQNVCATQGATLWKRLQRALNTAGIRAPLRGATTDSAIQVDGTPGFQTLTGLERYALRIAEQDSLQGYDQLAVTIRQDRDNGRTLSRSTLAFAIWAATGEIEGWEDVGIPLNAILPRAGVAPAADNNADAALTISCWVATSAGAPPVQLGPAVSSTGRSLAPSSGSTISSAPSTGVGAWLDRRTTAEKVGLGVLAAGGLWLAFGKKRKGKR